MEFPAFPSAYALAGLFTKHGITPNVGDVGSVKDDKPCGCAITVLAIEYCGFEYSPHFKDFTRQDGLQGIDMYDVVASHFGLETDACIANGFDGIANHKDSIGKERDELAYLRAQECARLLGMPILRQPNGHKYQETK